VAVATKRHDTVQADSFFNACMKTCRQTKTLRRQHPPPLLVRARKFQEGVDRQWLAWEERDARSTSTVQSKEVCHSRKPSRLGGCPTLMQGKRR